jgi:ankyrin repeat protein
MNPNSEPSQDLINEFVGAAHGDFNRVRELLEQYPALLNADATWTETAIQAATQMGNLEIVEYLLAKGAPLDICTAAVLGMHRKVSEFLEAEPAQAFARGAHGIPVLYFPVIRGEQEIAELLLANGSDLNAGENGNTPLHGAVMFGQAAMVEWLLAHGANPQARDYEGKTPMERAVESGDARIQELLAASAQGA